MADTSKTEEKPKPTTTLDKPRAEVENKAPANLVEKLSVQKAKKFHESKKRLKDIRERVKQGQAVEKEKADAKKDLDAATKGFEMWAWDPPKGKENFVESPEVKDKKEIERVEQEALKALKEKHDVEMEEALKNIDINALDTQNRGAIHVASLASKIKKIDSLPQKTKEIALKGLQGPDGKAIDTTKPLSPDQTEIVQKYLAADYIKALSNLSPVDINNPNKLAEIEKIHPGITDFVSQQDVELLTEKTFFEKAKKEPEIMRGFIDSIEKDGILVTGITPGSELGKSLVAIIKSNVDEYLLIQKPQDGLVDIENFKGLKDILGSSYEDLIYSHDFLLGEDHPLKKSRDMVLSWFEDEVAQIESPDANNATPEKIQAYKKSVGKAFTSSTGVDASRAEKAIKQISRNKLSPLMRFLADLFAPLGALMPGEVGDFWRDYLSNKDKAEGPEKYGNGRAAPFEGKWVENASASAIYNAAKAYDGTTSESSTPELIRKMHASAGLNAGAGTPWCMSFVQHVLRNDMWFNSSQIGPPTASAADGHKIGKHTDAPKQWDIVLIYRSGGSGRHIGFVDSVDAQGNVNVLGGNQSDSVRVSTYPKSKVAEFRTLEDGPTIAQGNWGESWHESGQNSLPESKWTVDQVISYEQSLNLMTDPSTPKYDEQWRLIIYKVDVNGYKRDPKIQSVYNTNIGRGDKDKRFIALHGTAADYGVPGGLTDEKLDQSWFHTMLNTWLYPYFVSKKWIVFSTTENDANHPACINDKANAITGYDRLNNKGIAIEMSLRSDGKGSVEKPNDKQMQSGRDLIMALRGKYNIGAGNVITSKDPVRDPVTWEFKGEHSDDFDDSVRAAMGIARYADTAKRFREKQFFTDTLATNPKVELATWGDYGIRLKEWESIDVTPDKLNSVLRWTLAGAWLYFIEAGKMYGIQPRFLAAIAMHETGNGTSPKSQTGNLMGISNNTGAIDYSDKSAVLNYFSSRGLKHHEEKWKYASIYDQAYKLSNYGPYQGKNTLAEVQSVYAPTPKEWPVQNDSRNLNRFWLWKVGEWMNKIW